ncbi:MAG: DUF72 domain-containing protein [Nitrososphaeria archaeon]|nr:DUF72 domain-containing protein [Nitrososphaeria archaeon]
MGQILLGTSGWSYKEWVGPLYESKDKVKLSAYVEVFDTAEINSTFYAYPSQGLVYGWLRHSKKGFVFTAKLPKLITHEKKLDLDRDVESDLNRFCELMNPLRLGGKLGCLLIQLPPSFRWDYKRLEGFFKLLPDKFRFAVEFRHLSWMRKETWRLLKNYNVAYTIVDEPLLPPEVHVTADFAYFRWHGKGHRPWFNYLYKEEELRPWIPKVEEVCEKTKAVFGYFNNHFHGYAVENCLQILEMLGLLTSRQREAKKVADRHLEEKIASRALDTQREVESPALSAETEEESLEDLLRAFMDDNRLRRARKIKNREVTIQETETDGVAAKIRRYSLTIDPESRVILHDCADWSRCAPQKMLCKHIGKVLLMMPREKALGLSKRLRAERDSWQFKVVTL